MASQVCSHHSHRYTPDQSKSHTCAQVSGAGTCVNPLREVDVQGAPRLPPPLAEVSSAPVPLCPPADPCAALSLHLLWVFTCSSTSPQLSSFPWFIQIQTSKLILTASSARRLLLPRAGCRPSVLATPALFPLNWTRAGPLCLWSAHLHPSCLTLCCDCRPSSLSSHWTLDSLNGMMPFRYTPSPGSLNEYLTNEAMPDPYLITMWNVSCSNRVECVFLNCLLLVLLLLFHQWDYMLPTNQIHCLFSFYSS